MASPSCWKAEPDQRREDEGGTEAWLPCRALWCDVCTFRSQLLWEKPSLEKTKPPARTVKRTSPPVTHVVMRHRTLYSPPLADVCSQERREEELSRTTFDSAGVPLEHSDLWPLCAAGPWQTHLGSRFLFFFPNAGRQDVQSESVSSSSSTELRRLLTSINVTLTHSHTHILDTFPSTLWWTVWVMQSSAAAVWKVAEVWSCFLFELRSPRSSDQIKDGR